MSDILSAISLFLAVLGLLYSTWYSALEIALNIELPKYKKDRGPALDTLNSTFYTKSLPLTISSIIISIIVLPDILKTLAEAISILFENGRIVFRYYDSVKTLFIGIYVLLLAFTIYLTNVSLKINSLLRKCK